MVCFKCKERRKIWIGILLLEIGNKALLIDLESPSRSLEQEKSRSFFMEHTWKRKRADNEVIDMELDCTSCGTRLYAPVVTAGYVVAVVQSGGTAFLICGSCGQVQSVRQKQRKTHD